MTTPSGAAIPGASAPGSLLDYISQVDPTNVSKTDATPKVNQQGQVDIFGIGENSGVSFPIGTHGYSASSVDAMDQGNGQITQSAIDNGGITYVTTDQYLSQLAALSQANPDEYEQVQMGLWKAGFYGNVKADAIGLGRWNAATQDALVGKDGALTNYLKLYQSGATVDTFADYLNKESSLAANDPFSPGNPGGVQASGSAGSNQRPLTNPAQIEQQGDQMSQSLLGRAMTPGEQQSVISDTHGQEINALNAGDVYLRSVTPTSVAREYILNNDLPEYAQHQVEGFMNAFANMFLSGGSQRANTGVADAAVPTSTGGSGGAV